MGKQTIYIRVEDEAAWDAIKDKPEFLHNALQVADSYKKLDAPVRKEIKKAVYNGLTNIQAKVDKSNPEINEMFRVWEEIIGIPISSHVKQNRNACSNLLKKYGKEKLTQLIAGVAQTHSDQYAPRIANFIQLQSKQDELIIWGRRTQQSTKGKLTVIS